MEGMEAGRREEKGRGETMLDGEPMTLGDEPCRTWRVVSSRGGLGRMVEVVGQSWML